MKRTLLQKAVCLILSVTILLGLVSITASAAAGSTLKPNGTASSLEDMQALVNIKSYAEYIKDYKGANGNFDENGAYLSPKPLQTISLDLSKGYGDAEGNKSGDLEFVKDSADCSPELWGDSYYVDKDGSGAPTKAEDDAVYLPTTDDNGQAAAATFPFTVESGNEGLFYLYVEYYNVQNKDTSVSSIQRKFKIDGKVPFSEVSNITFNKHWTYSYITEEAPVPAQAGAVVGTTVEYPDPVKNKDDYDGYYKIVRTVYEAADGSLMESVKKYKITQDINDNSMAPEAVEKSEWSTYICADTSGYNAGYFAFYLPYGQHTITFEAEREPVIIKSISFVPASDDYSLGTSVEGVDAASSVMSYTEYTDLINSTFPGAASAADGNSVRLEAEFPDMVSDSSVMPSNINDNAANWPISPKSQIYNVIGKTSFKSVGQWAAYKFTVNSSGFYKIGMRYLQSSLEGMFVCRTVKLSGGDKYPYGLADGSATVPFEEAQSVRFNYSKDWQSDYLSHYEGDDKTELEFYFEAGEEYTLYLECSLGDLSDYIGEARKTLNSLNEAYLKIIQRTGASPDPYQDYRFYEIMPEVVVALGEGYYSLMGIKENLEELCGTSGSHLATLETISRVLKEMAMDKGDNIAKNLSTFKSYLGTLGTWISNSEQGSLIIDTIRIAPVDTTEELPKAKAGFFKSIWHEIKSFVYSFFTDYDQMGLTEIPDENTATVEVWLAMGRDQSQIWRNLIDSADGYTKTTGNAVALKLITGGTLLPSILAGKGPDVYLGLGSSEVINYAIRNAIIGISGNDASLKKEEIKDGVNYNSIFTINEYANAEGAVKQYTDAEVVTGVNVAEGYTSPVSLSLNGTVMDLAELGLTEEEFKDETKRANAAKENNAYNFAPAAMNTLELLDVTYGVPMTMSFAMMFYRMDVLAELGKEVPESWDELLAVLPDLQANNMTMGVSYINALDFMMYQRGGNMWKYTNSLYGEQKYDPAYTGSKIDLDSPIALDAFEFVCRLYTEYSLPVAYDSANRFRTGEMPIIIGDYISIYNTLAVFASEIGGLWEFCSLPGSENEFEEDGFNYDSLAGVTATVIPNGCDNYKAAWQFVRWQTGSYAQSTYGNKIVALIGPAAKYETANLKAIDDMSWTASEKAAIKDQMNNLNAIVNYPGSYIIARYMKFAFLDAYNDGIKPSEAMQSYIPAINDEIKRKREEFEMLVAEDEEDALLKNNISSQ